VIYPGHYAGETFGSRALPAHLSAAFGSAGSFIDRQRGSDLTSAALEAYNSRTVVGETRWFVSPSFFLFRFGDRLF
jgi:hypothetical protein